MKGNLFDRYTVLHGLPIPGQKVKYVKPSKWCWHTNILEDEKNLLELGKEYTVRKVNLNSSSTYVFLEEFWIEGLDEYRNNQKFFNLHAFDWEMPEINLDDLKGFHIFDLGQIVRWKDVCIESKDNHYFGDTSHQKIIVELNEQSIVTNAKYEHTN